MESKLLITGPSADYELIDSGAGEKLERFGSYILSRPDPQALWKKLLPESQWQKAHARFARTPSNGRAGGKKPEWIISENLPKKWTIEIVGMKFFIRPTSFKHTGIFPEQSENWQWVKAVIEKNKNNRKIKVLNLFGYTGGATLAALSAGADVTHIDGSKVAMTWAKENVQLNGLVDKPVRWILDDATTFVKREIKRGNHYDAIIMDPPTFGRGPQGEIWKLEDHFVELLDECKKVLSDNPLFFIINGYASGYSAQAYGNALSEIMSQWKGYMTIGELGIQESNKQRLLPAGIFARWENSQL